MSTIIEISDIIYLVHFKTSIEEVTQNLINKFKLANELKPAILEVVTHYYNKELRLYQASEKINDIILSYNASLFYDNMR